MNVGIVTYHFAENSGAVLQCVALSKVISELDAKAYVINYRPKYHTKYYAAWKSPNSILYYRKKKYGTKGFKAKIILTVGYIQTFLSNFYHPEVLKWRRKFAFSQFINKNLNQTKVFRTLEQIKNNSLNFDLCIAGSDQIWNKNFTQNQFDPVYLLKFGYDFKKMSYAASTGVILEDVDYEELVNQLRDFDIISIREEQLYEKLKNKKLPLFQNVDPVFLLDKCSWEKYIKPVNDKKPFILVYSLEKSIRFSEIIQKLNVNKKYEVIDISPYHVNTDYACKYVDICPPDKFLSYIHSADYIITNSFHATAFALIFHKEFTCIPHSVSGSRMLTLLKLAGMQGHLDNGEKDYNPVIREGDFCKVDQIFRKEREKSLSLLKQFIQKEGK